MKKNNIIYENIYESLYSIKGSGNRIRALRQLKGLTLEELAAKIEVSTRQYAYRLENQDKVGIKIALKLAEALDTSAEYIMCKTDNPKKKMSKKYILSRIKEIHGQMKDLNSELSELIEILDKDLNE